MAGLACEIRIHENDLASPNMGYIESSFTFTANVHSPCTSVSIIATLSARGDGFLPSTISPICAQFRSKGTFLM